MALNKNAVGKEYPPQEYVVTAEETKKYAYGYNEESPFFLDESRQEGIIAPPMFGVKYAGIPFAQAFFDPDFNVDFARLVHGEHDMSFLSTVKPGDTITSVGKILQVEEKSTGEIFVLEVRSKNQHGNPVLTMCGTFFIRGSKTGGEKKKEPEEPFSKNYVFSQSMNVKDNQTYIYAEGSGDHNPIHVNPDFARSVGLPGIILQGLCTMAFSFKAIQDEYCQGDPRKIKRLKVRFAKPVLPSDTVITRGWIEGTQQGLTVLGIEAVNQHGDIVLRNGLAHVTT